MWTYLVYNYIYLYKKFFNWYLAKFLNTSTKPFPFYVKDIRRQDLYLSLYSILFQYSIAFFEL